MSASYLESHRDGMSGLEYAVPMGLSGHGGFGFYKYAAPTELKTDMPFVTFQKLFYLLSISR
ncbi:hypothetical protein QUF75_20275 [Desulfococcaceae bacterium HSG7]|nr:hypothetical protein [Desulfococcaceae bacterium HSG7]